MPNSKAKNQHGATNDEVLKAVNILADKTDHQFGDIFEVVTFIKDNAVMRDEFNDEISGIKTEISGIKTTMVTKDYLDEKMSDLRGDLVVMMRKEDTKLKTLVGVLKEKEVLNGNDVKRIYSMEPFAQ